jgi:hypothetical protein
MRTVIAACGHLRNRELGPALLTIREDRHEEAWLALGLPGLTSDHHSARATLHRDRKGRPHVDPVWFRYHGTADGRAREITEEKFAAAMAAVHAVEHPDDE